MRKIILILAALAALTTTATITSPAYAAPGNGTVRLERPDHRVSKVRATYAQRAGNGRVWVEFNTGSLWSVVPCRHEDSRRCYWDASAHGNGKGRSFVHLNGHRYRLPQIRY